jgi:signal peptidase II
LVKKFQIFAIVVPLVLLLDQLTKFLILQNFALHDSIPILRGYFNLTYVQNPGAAFGMLSGSDPSFRGPFFVIVPAIALTVIAYLFIRLPPKSTWIPAALSCLVGGAVGNLIDRFRFGYVVDFIDFHWHYKAHFPAFNIADLAISLGIGILILDMLFERDPEAYTQEKQEAPHASDPH